MLDLQPVPPSLYYGNQDLITKKTMIKPVKLQKLTPSNVLKSIHDICYMHVLASLTGQIMITLLYRLSFKHLIKSNTHHCQAQRAAEPAQDFVKREGFSKIDLYYASLAFAGLCHPPPHN
jgi:hypothetical protein